MAGNIAQAAANKRPPRIVIGTTGTLGDLFPVLAVAAALRDAGADVGLMVQGDHLDIARAHGFDAIEILPGLDDLATRLNTTAETILRRVFDEQDYLFSNVIIPTMPDAVTAAAAFCQGADLIAGTLQVAACPIMAEVLGVPYVQFVLQPLVLLDPADPPIGKGLWAFRLDPGPLALRWNRLVRKTVRLYLRRLAAAGLDAARAGQGLPPSRALPFFDADAVQPFRLALYPDILSGPSDLPEPILHTGFCALPPKAPLDDALTQWLADGPPPLVFTLGSSAPRVAGRFYDISRSVAARLGRRAVLLTGAGTPDTLTDSCATRAYVDHALIFPHAAAVIHQGGIGTTGQALLSGRPQLVVPYGLDQPDNARRIAGLGCGRHLPIARYTEAAALRDIGALLSQPRYAQAARRIAGHLTPQTGPADAARALIAAACGESALHA